MKKTMTTMMTKAWVSLIGTIKILALMTTTSTTKFKYISSRLRMLRVTFHTEKNREEMPVGNEKVRTFV